MRLDAGLFFANSDTVEERVRELIHSGTGVDAIVLDGGGINFVDSQGSAKLDDILTMTREAGVTLRLARVKPAVAAVLRRDGVWDGVGADRIHANIDHAVRAQLGQTSAEAMPRSVDL